MISNKPEETAVTLREAILESLEKTTGGSLRAEQIMKELEKQFPFPRPIEELCRLTKDRQLTANARVPYVMDIEPDTVFTLVTGKA